MRRSRSRGVTRAAAVGAIGALLAGSASAAVAGGFAPPARHRAAEIRSLDGSGNNRAHPSWGQAGTAYRRVGAANYADGVGAMVDGPNSRYISNRIFNDIGQNLFSEHGISQWGWTWGQFLDHDLGLRDETPAEAAPIAFDNTDPLEDFTSDFGGLQFDRTPAADGTGTTSTRQQINTISSYIDASNVYGTTSDRLGWLRNGASLLLPNGYLPNVGARGDASTAPAMDLMGMLMGMPDRAVVAGDVRANENIALTALHTLFAREHNRIAASLPGTLSDQERFDIARRVVGAEVQWITYTEFLPALGVKLRAYRGYDSNVNPTLTNEFATVGYRAHSMVHGEFDVDYDAGEYSATQLDAFRAQGISVEDGADEHALVIPLTVAFGNPDLLPAVGLGPVLAALSQERQYNNDEQIDNTLRSVLFEVPKPGVTDPAACQVPVVYAQCFSGVADLGADDIERGRDHGMPSYNDMRRAYGLRPKTSFAAITGEATDQFPTDPEIDAADPVDDPSILDFVDLRDADGNPVDPASPEASEEVVHGTRRTTLAARLKAIYGSVDNLDAFVGMVAEPHVGGSELGELQRAIWTQQFTALRDGDRFFYSNDPELARIKQTFGVTYRHSLAELINLNTGADVGPSVFYVGGDVPPGTPPVKPPNAPSAAPANPRDHRTRTRPASPRRSRGT